MSNQCCDTNTGHTGTGSSFVFILVLYILVAIILGSWVTY